MRRYLIIFAVSWLLPLTGFLSVKLLLDPYRIYHQPWIRDNYYLGRPDMRIQASGIINTEDFDSIVLGDSMAANFSPSEAANKFGGKFVNISLDGSSAPERSLVLNYALKKKEITMVIFSIDRVDLAVDSIANTGIARYAYLYDDNRLNDLLLYLSHWRDLRFAFCGNRFVSSDRRCKEGRDLERLCEWYSEPGNARRIGGLQKWFESAKDDIRVMSALRGVSEEIEAIASGTSPAVDWAEVRGAQSRHQQVFRTHILEVAAEHPATQFYLFFPPFSRLRYAMLKQGNPQDFESYLEIIRFVVRDCAKYHNIQVFGFDTESFLDDIANYIDTSHYDQGINSEMLRWMRDGVHALTPLNVDDYIEMITAKAETFSLRKIGAEIRSFSGWK